jgi:hypothetical protein
LIRNYLLHKSRHLFSPQLFKFCFHYYYYDFTLSYEP